MEEKRTKQIKDYYLANKEIIKLKRIKYLEDNKEKITKQKKENYLLNQTKIIKKQKEWNINNKDKINTYRKNRFNNEPLFKLKINVKNLIGNSFRNNGYFKLSKTQEILGCTYEQLKLHLESKFEPWMNWDNRGLYNGELNYGWDIDHIIPLDNATTEEDIINLNNYTNLQPLCGYTNRHIKRHYITII